MKNVPCKIKSAYLLSDRILRKYFTEVDIAEGVLIIGENKTYFTDSRYYCAAKDKLSAVNIECKLFKDVASVFDFLTSLGVENLYVDYRTTTVKEYEEYKSKGVQIFDCSDELEKLMSIKTECEIESIKKACEITQKAYYQAIKTVKKGMTEKDLKDTLEKFTLSLGADDIAFETIVAFGANSAVPHHETGETILENNMPILVDMGCKINGYCSDLTRTAFFGKPDKEFTTAYKAVLNANLIAEEKIALGMCFKNADKIARDYLSEKGYGEYFTHSLGHGVGLQIHEFPTLSPRGVGKIKENMVFTVEPGVYLDYKFGIRIEDTVVMQGQKLQRLFTDDKELLIL